MLRHESEDRGLPSPLVAAHDVVSSGNEVAKQSRLYEVPLQGVVELRDRVADVEILEQLRSLHGVDPNYVRSEGRAASRTPGGPLSVPS